MNTRNHTLNGKVDCRGSKIHNNTKNWMNSMDNQWSSSTPENFPQRIVFMSMFNDIIWRDTKNQLTCSENSTMVIEYAKSFALGRWSFLGPSSETKMECHRHC